MGKAQNIGNGFEDIRAYLENVFPVESCETWDNSGVYLKPKENEIKGIAIGLSLDKKLIEFAVKNEYNLIITHHPIVIEGISTLENGRSGELTKLLLKNGIGLISLHTNFDLSLEGLNMYIGEILELKNRRFIEKINSDSIFGVGVLGNLKDEIVLRNFLDRLKEIFNCKKIRIPANISLDIKVKKVAFLGGSGKTFIEKSMGLSDIYISSDFKYHDFENAAYHNFPIADIGHFNSEVLGMNHLASIIKKVCKYKVEVLKTAGEYSIDY